MKFNRIFTIVLDSLGAGEASDANSYGDTGANTIKNVASNTSLFIPNLTKLGFLNIVGMNNEQSEAYYTIAKPNNPGKDTLNGHYEMMGVATTDEYKTFPETGFPMELIKQIEAETGRRVIGNVRAISNDIINELGEMQMKYGALIIYTSFDSVLEVAAHEAIVPIETLYKYCEIIRNITKKTEWRVGRVIARPFTGNCKGKFNRIPSKRCDFALNPPYNSVLDHLKESKYDVISIGKIYDIFNGRGITKKIVASSNKETVDKILDIMEKKFTGLCYANLSDFDTEYGHKRDVKGYAGAIEAFDVDIPMILNKLNNDDLLIITADHGNDPTFKGYSHTRENVPVIIYSRIFNSPKKLHDLDTMADIGATIADNFDVQKTSIGLSFLDDLK